MLVLAEATVVVVLHEGTAVVVLHEAVAVLEAEDSKATVLQVVICESHLTNFHRQTREKRLISGCY